MLNVRSQSRPLPRHPLTARPWTLAALAVVLAAGLSVGCAQDTESDDSAAPSVNAEFRLPTLDGEKMGPTDFPGQIVLVDFWATWCVPCRKQAEVLHALHQELDGSSVQFLAVDLGEDEETVRSFLENDPIPYPVLLDVEDHLTYEMGIYGLPTLMVVDPQGKVTYFETGLITEKELRRELARAGFQG